MTNFSGGYSVKASTLLVGDTIRSPRKQDVILIVESTGSQVFARGYEKEHTKEHMFIPADTLVIKVFQASTETTVDGTA